MWQGECELGQVRRGDVERSGWGQRWVAEAAHGGVDGCVVGGVLGPELREVVAVEHACQ